MSGEFSIVIPVKNRESLILRALDSVKAQTYRPLKIIVVDNASTDSTIQSVNIWASVNCTVGLSVEVLEESASGACAARNRGLQRVNSSWMLFFDSDDTMEPELVERVVATVKGNPDVEMIYWKCLVRNIDGEESFKKYRTSRHWHSHIYNSQFCTQCYAAKTELFKSVGGWNPDMSVWNDWELGIRLLLSNPKRIGIPEVLTIIYAQRESITGVDHHSKAGEWEKAIDEAERVVAEADIDEELKSKLLDMINYRRVNLAALYRREKHPEYALTLETEAKRHNHGRLKWLWLKILEKYTEMGGRGAYIFWR